MITIRQEQTADLAAIYQVIAQAFGGAAEANLVNQLRANGKAIISLVATDAEQLVGHILFSPVTLESASQTTTAIGLAPLAVLPAYQNQGLGSRLTQKGLE